MFGHTVLYLLRDASDLQTPSEQVQQWNALRDVGGHLGTYSRGAENIRKWSWQKLNENLLKSKNIIYEMCISDIVLSERCNVV